jgi:hypothetical protein
MNIDYIPIDSILFKLGSILESSEFSESKFREWAAEAYLSSQISCKYSDKVILQLVEEHKATMPRDMKYLNQIMYKEKLDSDEINEIKEQINLIPESIVANPDALATRAFNTMRKYNTWKPLRQSTSSFIKTVDSNLNIVNAPTYCCDHEFTIDYSRCLTTTLPQGYILVSYKGIIQSDGNILIPNNESLKNALFHYCLYMHWMSKSLLKEQGSIQEREWHLQRYAYLIKKAVGEINMPSLNQLENLKNQSIKMKSSFNDFANGFQSLNKRELL